MGCRTLSLCLSAPPSFSPPEAPWFLVGLDVCPRRPVLRPFGPMFGEGNADLLVACRPSRRPGSSGSSVGGCRIGAKEQAERSA